MGESAALRAQVGVHPPVGIHFGGGVYDPRQEASYEGAVEGLTITRPIKPLAWAAPATSSTKGPTGAPPGAPPSAAANVRTALGAMGTIGPEPNFEVPPPPLVVPHPREDGPPRPPGGRSPSDGPPPPPRGPHYHHTRTFSGTKIAA